MGGNGTGSPGLRRAGRAPPEGAGQPRWRRSAKMPVAAEPQYWTPPLDRSPVQMMISVRAGRISLTAFSVAVGKPVLRRFPPLAGGSSGQRRMSPLTRALNFSTTYRSSERPEPKRWVRKVFAVLPGIAVAVLMMPSPSCRLGKPATGRPSPDIPAAVPIPATPGLFAGRCGHAASGWRRRCARQRGLEIGVVTPVGETGEMPAASMFVVRVPNLLGLVERLRTTGGASAARKCSVTR